MKKAALAFSLLALAANAQAQSAGPVTLLSSLPLSGNTGGGYSAAPRFSADGQFLLFTSTANNLVTNDDLANFSDIFLHDLAASSNRLISISTNGVGGGNGDSSGACLSSNAQIIAFQSLASNLASNDNNGVVDVFVRDLAAGLTRLVSANPSGTASGNGRSFNPVITPDGRWVAFESQATDLVAGDNNSIQDVFLRDLQTSTSYLVSVGAQGASRRSTSASLSDDGQRVAFESNAQFFSSNLTASLGEVYVRDRVANATIWASSNLYALTAAAHKTYRAFNPALSGDGLYLAFKTAPSLSVTATGASLYVFDLQSGQLSLLATNTTDATLPEISPDGRWVAFEAGTNVYLWDRNTGTNTLVSVDVSGLGPANGTSTRPALNPNGGKVLFFSDAANLTTNSVNGKTQLYLRDLASSSTQLVSARPDGSSGGDLSASRADLDPSGTRVTFESDDERLVADDYNQASDVFLRDTATQLTRLISARAPGLPSKTPAGRATLGHDALSADGRYAVLSAFDSVLVPGDRNAAEDAFLGDLATGANLALAYPGGANLGPNVATIAPLLSANGEQAAFFQRNYGSPFTDQLYVYSLLQQTNRLISRAWNNALPAAGSSRRASFDRSGSRMTFESDAPDITPADSNNAPDVFLWDSAYGSNLLVSVNLAGTASGNFASINPLISRDGRWVVFRSRATDLVTHPSVNSATYQLYARDLSSNTTALISVDSLGNWMSASNPIISADSRAVLFSGPKASLFAYNLYAGTSTLVCTQCLNASPSADARWVVFEALGAVRNVVLADLQTSSTNLISTNRFGTGGGNAASFAPQISYDGRYVAFLSRASDLVQGVSNGWAQVFVWDRLSNHITLQSSSILQNGPGNGPSFNPTLGSDGRTVLFQSYASDLISGDFDNDQSVFAFRLNAPDADGDGLDDDWEWAHFGTLGRDGHTDFDGDGQSDLQEYLSGTDPGSANSALKLLTVASLAEGSLIFWTSTPGKAYRVQFKNNLDEPAWTDLPGLVTASDSTSSKLDPSAGLPRQRFYRVLLSL